MIVKCNDNNGIGDCPLKMLCFARMNDQTISGCGLPFVLAGMIDKSEMVVEHIISTEMKERKEECH